MTNPLFQYFDSNRNVSDRVLFSPNIETVKRYENSPQIGLNTPDTINFTYSQLINKRRSHRAFEGMQLSVPDLANILYWSMSPLATPVQNDCEDGVGSVSEHRPYPSGGAKYPLEAYVLTDAHPELATAAYHYRPDIHRLEQVTVLTTDEIMSIKASYVYSFVPPIPVLILLTYIMERNVPKYGSLGGKLALIEAGHIGQNISLVAASVGASSLMLAGGDGSYIDTTLGLDSYNESMFYTIGLGKHYTK